MIFKLLNVNLRFIFFLLGPHLNQKDDSIFNHVVLIMFVGLLSWLIGEGL